MTPLPDYDRKSDWEQGYSDAHNRLPRASTRPHYRAGYDRGLSDLIRETQCQR